MVGVVVCVAGVVVVHLRRLSLGVLLVLHPSVLKPDLHLPLGEHQTPRQLPPLLLRHVGVVEELFLQLQRLVFGVRFPLLADRHLACPF